MSKQRRRSFPEAVQPSLLSRAEEEGRWLTTDGMPDGAPPNGQAAVGRVASETRAFLTPDEVDAIAEATANKLAVLVREPVKTFALVGPREVAEAFGCPWTTCIRTPQNSARC